MKKNKAKHLRVKPKVKRSTAAGHTFKTVYGRKVVKEPDKTRKPEAPKCRVCNEGVLERRQWNILTCTNINCNHKELQLA